MSAGALPPEFIHGSRRTFFLSLAVGFCRRPSTSLQSVSRISVAECRQVHDSSPAFIAAHQRTNAAYVCHIVISAEVSVCVGDSGRLTWFKYFVPGLAFFM